MMIAGKIQFLRPAIAVIAVSLAWMPAFLQADTPAKKPSYDNYRLLKTRNIFDPDRRAMNVSQQGPPVKTTKAATRSDYVALTGVMVTGEKSLAFFSGSRSEYSKVLPVKGVIAGATVVQITPANIIVERDGKQITVAVGQTVPFDGSAPGAAPAPDVTTSSSSTSNPQPSSANAPSTDRSEIMRRMMERRQQQLK